MNYEFLKGSDEREILIKKFTKKEIKNENEWKMCKQ